MNTLNQSANSQNPPCQRATCPNQGTVYGEASRRVTLEITQEVAFPATLNGLNFTSRRRTVDLCMACYHFAIKHDKRFQTVEITGIGPYARCTDE
jgi:hypothetical protein